MIRVGIIGCGKIAQVRHIPEYLAHDGTQIAAYFSRTHSRAQELAGRYGGTAYARLADLLADESIDAVSICTANAVHAEHAIAALEAGKHVLCEKPMATTIEDCQAMLEAAATAGKVLMIDQNQRLAPAHRKAKELVEAGVIGDVLTFRTTFGHGGPETWSINPGAGTWFFDAKAAAMGALADLGVHKTDLIQYLLGAKVAEVTAKVATLDKRSPDGRLIGVDDNAMCIYTMDSGVVGTMTASWTHYGAEDNTTILYGTQGIMRIYDDPAYALRLVLRNGEEVDYRLEGIQTNDAQTSTGIVEAFAGCIEGGGEPLISGESVVHAMRAVFAGVESSQTGRSIRVLP
ncbi:MAG: Gfo/Idh/MocA family oxidoreductase [Actinomycetaceae bacterium]|nr:Gfo/Idh/MocA family oxidoreductase [Actinomycetaceae bacterium]